MSLFLRILLSLLATTALLAGAALSGALFRAWPTSLDDRVVSVTPQTLDLLRALQQERKFDPDEKTGYPGARDEATRAASQARIDKLIETLLCDLPTQPRRSFVLQTFKTALPAFAHDDTEEQDEALAYLERILDITGLDDSGELLDVWRYGWPVGWFVQR